MRLIIVLIYSLFTQIVSAETIVVNNADELNARITKAMPGDIILLASGEWKDSKIVLEGRGTAKKSIIVTAQKAGSVILSGNSSLHLSGEFITVKDLHFKNGFANGSEVIAFRTSTKKLASNCRITGVVIENFSKPDRLSNDNWVVLWGKNNRVDHCTFINKLNIGPTLIVELTDERSQENYHSIDSNYFKGRQRLGSNGGESIRIGVSKNSLSASRTSIKFNVFEKCNGEVEVVSVKSGDNHIAFNTFIECEGGLVLRHGNNNTVEGNLFLGNNKPFTAGVRVINANQKVYNNVFKDLKGEDFRSALAVMNGVPNSLINRYHQVKNADIHHNTFINCSNIEFGVGKDAERTDPPIDVSFRNNLLVDIQDPVFINKNGYGVTFSYNIIFNSPIFSNVPKGFSPGKTSLKQVRGVLLPKAVSGIGANIDKLPLISPLHTGASWLTSPGSSHIRKNTRTFLSRKDAASFQKLLDEAIDGDSIVLTETGDYNVESELKINRKVTIVGWGSREKKPVLVNRTSFPLPSFFCLENGGELLIRDVEFNGSIDGYADVKAGIRSTSGPMNRPYKLTIDGCKFYNFNESTFSAFKASKGTYADELIVRNCLFRNISGNAIDLSAEKDDKGRYNAEYVTIENCLFTNVLGSALNLYRGGNDESTTGPFLKIDHCTFHEVDNREQGFVLRLPGVQKASITNCIFSLSGQGGRSIYFQEYKRDKLVVDHCNFFKSGKVESFQNSVMGINIFSEDPNFLNPAGGIFRLASSSVLQNKSSSAGPLGSNL
ncbi:polysaccharide lyase 6 family protein [Arcticibacter sp.]|uniref:polysaccharide lyase 6 family protein n=1 Tax=Arcticibacter sp. TaxID=1872630 RepID=UPI00388FF572